MGQRAGERKFCILINENGKMTHDLSKRIVQAIYTVKPEMLKWSPEANQLKLEIRRVKQ